MSVRGPLAGLRLERGISTAESVLLFSHEQERMSGSIPDPRTDHPPHGNFPLLAKVGGDLASHRIHQSKERDDHVSAEH
jgi:hypothetical protein